MLPVALVQLPQVHTVTVIPDAVAVIVGLARAGRVVITIDGFDDPVRIGKLDSFVRRSEEALQFVAQQVPVGLAHRTGKWLVDVADKNVARVRAD